MRASPLAADGPSVEARLARLDAQLQAFETALRSHQESHGRVRSLELELAVIVERGASIVRDLASVGDQVRQAADAATREAIATSGVRIQDFEQRAARILDAYAHAVRAAQQAVARAEARIDAFDDRVGQELAKAGRDVREAAVLLREQAATDAYAPRGHAPSGRAHRLVPALLAAGLLLAGLGLYSWVARTVRDASAQAAAAERRALDARREANEQIASIERSAQQASRDALAIARRSERLIDVLSAPGVRRIELFGQRRAPNASGQAIWSPSRGVMITATGLPAISDKETYQVWLATPRGSTSLGFITPDGQGSATGVFDLPAGAGSIWGFILTREPSGGATRPSRAVVLAS